MKLIDLLEGQGGKKHGNVETPRKFRYSSSWGSAITIHPEISVFKEPLKPRRGSKNVGTRKTLLVDGGHEDGGGEDEDSELRKGEGRLGGGERALLRVRVFGLHLGWDGEGKTEGGVPT